MSTLSRPELERIQIAKKENNIDQNKSTTTRLKNVKTGGNSHSNFKLIVLYRVT